MAENGNVDTKFAPLRTFLASLLLFCLCTSSFAQKGDSIRVSTIGTDSTKRFVKIKPKHSPSKAVMFSAVLPGLGQAYNHKYWKIPIIYAGLGVMAYFIITNQQQYNTFRAASNVANGNINKVDSIYPSYTLSDLVASRDYYHRNRDLSIIGATLIYVLNLVDAEVDAQLFSFSVSDDISMHITPTINTFTTGYGIGFAPSLSLRLNLK
jgi:hypothetical protein